MTSTAAFTRPRPTTRLADQRRFRQSIAGLVGAAVIGAGATVALAPAASAATADRTNPDGIHLYNQYYTNGTNDDITITDNTAASPYPSTVTFSDVHGTVTDVDVQLRGLTHAFPDDVDIMLVGPNGQRAILMSDVGGASSVSNVFVMLDDEAAIPLPAGSLIQEGTYRPTDDTSGDQADPDGYPAPAPLSSGVGTALSVFDGADPNGTWSLYVVDDDAGIAGLLSGWTIRLRTTGGMTPYPSTVQVAGATGTVSDVDVMLHGFGHAFPDDLDVMLVGPGGRRALLMSDGGGNTGVMHLELGFDDEAGQQLPDGDTLTSTSYRPSDYEADEPFPAPAPTLAGIGTSLSVFDGADPNGAWQLFITDDAARDDGGIEGGWTLHLSTTDPAPTTTPGTGSSGTGSSGTGSSGTGTSATDTSHPRVNSHSPKTAATGVKRGVTVKAALSEKARTATITGSTVRLTRKGSTKAVAAEVRYDPTTRTVSIDPAARLKAGTTYRVVLTTGITDLAGNALDQKPAKTGLQKAVWTFTTR